MYFTMNKSYFEIFSEIFHYLRKKTFLGLQATWIEFWVQHFESSKRKNLAFFSAGMSLCIPSTSTFPANDM